MLCPECGEVTAPGPLDLRKGMFDQHPSLFARLRGLRVQGSLIEAVTLRTRTAKPLDQPDDRASKVAEENPWP